MNDPEIIDIKDKNNYGPASDVDLRSIKSFLGSAIYEDYINFLSKYDGLSGYIGGNYIEFWPARDVERYNREYETNKYAPGIILFGSDGGGEGYGFDTSTEGPAVVRIPFIGMSREDAIFVCAGFSGFLDAVRAGR